jgi:hypothetical protein
MMSEDRPWPAFTPAQLDPNANVSLATQCLVNVVFSLARLTDQVQAQEGGTSGGGGGGGGRSGRSGGGSAGGVVAVREAHHYNRADSRGSSPVGGSTDAPSVNAEMGVELNTDLVRRCTRAYISIALVRQPSANNRIYLRSHGGRSWLHVCRRRERGPVHGLEESLL